MDRETELKILGEAVNHAFPWRRHVVSDDRIDKLEQAVERLEECIDKLNAMLFGPVTTTRMPDGNYVITLDEPAYDVTLTELVGCKK